jgi:transposase
MSTHSNASPLFVGIDIGKNVHAFGGYLGLELKVLQAPCEVRSNRVGFAQFAQWLSACVQSGSYAPIVVGIEPTGVYHEAWVYALQQTYGAQLEIRFLNPYQTKQKRKQLFSGRQRKTDPIDVQAIAACLRDGLGHPATLRTGTTLHFELWATDYRQTHREQQRCAVRLLTQLDRLWPGALINVRAFEKAHPHLPLPTPLVLSKPLERQRLQLLLEHRPNPYAWKTQSVQEVQAFYRSHGLRCGPAMAQKLRTVVAQALFPPPELAALLAERLRTDYLHYQSLLRRLRGLQQQAEALVPYSEAAVLTTIPGIGAFLAAQYMAYLIDPHRFERADQIWSFAGFDVTQEESGDRRRRGKISKRGSAGLRLVLFRIGLNTSQYCPVIARAKRRALARGKRNIGAVLHAAHKANRICFHLLRHQIPFDPLLAR